MVENPLFCSACGAGLVRDASFCPQCGKPLSGFSGDEHFRENPLQRFNIWFKLLSIKGRIFYGFWIFINVSGAVKLISINSGLAGDNPACQDNSNFHVLRNFLNHSTENCSGYTSSSFGDTITSLVLSNGIFLGVRALYTYFKNRRENG
jgi:hypothetical protein